MKRYLKNLLTALLGRNPFRDELDGLREKYEKAGENVRSLQDMYYSALDKWTAIEKQAKSLQVLTENLWERIREKDELMEQMSRDYQQRISQQQEEIGELRKNLKL